MKIAHIKWFDAHYNEGPDYADGLESGITLHSAGILLEEAPDYIVIAGDWWESVPCAHCRHIHHIPKVNIIEMHTIEVADMKKRRKI